MQHCTPLDLAIAGHILEATPDIRPRRGHELAEFVGQRVQWVGEQFRLLHLQHLFPDMPCLRASLAMRSPEAQDWLQRNEKR